MLISTPTGVREEYTFSSGRGVHIFKREISTHLQAGEEYTSSNVREEYTSSNKHHPLKRRKHLSYGNPNPNPKIKVYLETSH
jgi:hypothetical protein